MWELCVDAHTNWVRVLSGDHSHSWYDWNLRTQQNPMHHWAWRIWRCVSQCVGLASQLLYLPTALRYTWCKRCPSTRVSRSAYAYWTQNSVPYNAHHCYMYTGNTGLWLIGNWQGGAGGGLEEEWESHCPVVRSIRSGPNFHLLMLTTLDLSTLLSHHDIV